MRCFRRHRRECGREEQFQFQCPYCSRTSNRKGNLKMHITTVHWKKVVKQEDTTKFGKRYSCHCGRSYKNPESLCRHRRECGRDKPYQCPHCHHRSHRSDNLKRHIALHFIGRNS
ncbi:zinc finger protein 555-like [Sitophilus oryzae]|uniref:Zinc finger protein 555-like n=1 Tax=Sitophilus oryzae TaxID=7048 RepID=A0A6J2YR87_SITOR|nr:zinc finger protein 555-like [Sitophilus oryzae]